MFVSVIIPSLYAVTLPRALAALQAQTRPADEIIVVGKEDAGIAFPNVRFVDTGQPVCAAKARNGGMREAKGDLFLFLDSDCVPTPTWLEQHVARQEAGEHVVGGSVMLKGSNYWAQSDNVSMFHDFLPAHPPSTRFLLPTLNLSVRREVWYKVGDMDESFPGAAAEDADWTIRIRRAGYRLFFDPTASIQHAPARTTWSDVVRHWCRLGYNAVRVRLRYQQEMNTPDLMRNARQLRWLSPLIAGKVTFDIYRQRALWGYWPALPVVYASKIIYCWGAAQAVDSGFAFR